MKSLQELLPDLFQNPEVMLAPREPSAFELEHADTVGPEVRDEVVRLLVTVRREIQQVLEMPGFDDLDPALCDFLRDGPADLDSITMAQRLSRKQTRNPRAVRVLLSMRDQLLLARRIVAAARSQL